MLKVYTSVLFILIFTSCSFDIEERDKVLSNIIQTDFILTDSLLTYQFMDTTTLKISFGQSAQFEKYMATVWIWRWNDNVDISKHSEYSTYTNPHIIKNNEMIFKNINLKGNDPDSLCISLDMTPVGITLVDATTSFSMYRYTPDSLTGILRPPPLFEKKITMINNTNLHAIEDNEIREYCKAEVRKVLKKVINL